MILSLQDNFNAPNDGINDCITLYDGLTGEPVLLASKATRKAKKEAKKEVKKAKIEAKKEKKIAKVRGKTQRVVQREEAKTQRQATRQLKRQTRQDVGVQKQEKRMIRVKGRQDIIKARQGGVLKKLFNKQTVPPGLPGGAPGAPGLPGAPGRSAPGGGGEEEYQDAEYEEVLPGEEEYQDAEYEEVLPGEEEYQEEEYQDAEYEEEPLSGGFIDILTKVGKGVKDVATQYVKGIVPGINLSPGNINLDSKQVIQLQNERRRLQAQLDKAKTNQLLFSFGSGALGLALGYIIAKK